MSLYQELKRRNVIRVAIAYLALAWLADRGVRYAVSGLRYPRLGAFAWW